MKIFRFILEKIKIYGLKQSLLFLIGEGKTKFYGRLIKKTYSQYGEDLIIDKLLDFKKRGVYIDIGAYDPFRFSNTNRFYKKGWRGINIEPDNERFKKFLKFRPRDINLNIGIGLSNKKLKFYIFQPDTLSTFSKRESETIQKLGFKLIEEKYVDVRRLDFIINKFLEEVKIDFMTIDTEGGELKVLKSNNWSKFRPHIICIESFSFETATKGGKERLALRRFLLSKSYKSVFQNSTNIIYIDRHF